MVKLIICGNQNVRNDATANFPIGYTFESGLSKKEKEKKILINSIWIDPGVTIW